jgi:hypothetical protein
MIDILRIPYPVSDDRTGRNACTSRKRQIDIHGRSVKLY